MSETMRGFSITQDLLDGGTEDSVVGRVIDTWADGSLIAEGPVVRFRLYDDDDNLYYEGVFGDIDDGRGDTQYDAVLNWGKWMAGCTYIKVKRGQCWTQEIG